MNYQLRPFKKDDVDSLVLHANNPKIARFMTDGFPFPYTTQHAIAFIESVSRPVPVQVFAITVDDQAVGGIGIHPQTDIMRKNAELGYWLGEKYWGNGIVSRAVKEMVAYGFKNFDISRIYARPFHTNLASQKILIKNNFVLEAHIRNNIYKNNEFLDEMIFAIRR